MCVEGEDFRDDGVGGPLDAEDFSELLEVVGGGLANGVHAVAKPCHAQVSELLVKKFDTLLPRLAQATKGHIQSLTAIQSTNTQMSAPTLFTVETYQLRSEQGDVLDDC